jgi:hypothetical protein
VALAEAVARNDKEVLVPIALSKLFHRAIQTRKNVARWLKSKTVVNNGKDSRHNYFVILLDNAFQILRPCISLGSRTSKSALQGISSDSITLENRFAGLIVEDIARIAEEEGVNEFDLSLVTSVILQQDETELEEDLKLAIGYVACSSTNSISSATLLE